MVWKTMDVLAARVQWWVMKMKWLRVRTWLWGFLVVLVSADLHTVYVYVSADVFWWLRHR